MNAAGQQREEARRHLRASRGRDDGWKKLWKVRKAAVLSFFWDFARKLETLTQEGDQAGFYKNLKKMNLEEKRAKLGVLRDVELVRKRWVRWFHTLLNAQVTEARPERLRRP